MEALTLRDIKEKLHSLFGEDNRLVFWYDGEGDFEDTVDTLVPDDVTVLRLTGRNAFRAKLHLEHEDPEGRYLIYAPFTKPDVRQNVLEDTLLYSKEFYADQLSYFMADAHIPSRLRPAMERLKPFFFGPGGRSSAKVRAEAARRREDFLERSQESIGTRRKKRRSAVLLSAPSSRLVIPRWTTSFTVSLPTVIRP